MPTSNRLREKQSDITSRVKEFLHVSQKEHRESIETKGLKPSKPFPDEHSGVYVFPHPGENPPKSFTENISQYGPGDVYKIKVSKKTKLYMDTGEMGHQGYFSHKSIPTSDFKRVGHTFRNNQGHAEIHWHREEDCPNG